MGKEVLRTEEKREILKMDNLEIEYENSNHLEPELTWENSATFIYDAVMEGKLNREDFIKYFILSGQEFCEPRNTRIFAKALAAFFKRDYTDLKSEEKPAVLVIVDNKKYLVSHNDKEITINEAQDFKDIPDNSFIITHEDETDGKIAAWERGEKFIERIK
jgi:hypothetical protein